MHKSLYRATIEETWRGLFEQANAWSVLIGTPIVGIAAWLMGVPVRIPDDPVGLFLFTICCVLIAAAVIFIWRYIDNAAKIHAAAQERIKDLEAGLKPKIRIVPDHVEPKGSEEGTRFVRLVVENISETSLRNCRVREKIFTNVYGYSSGMQRYFRLGEEAHARMAEHTYKRTFDLPGKGATEIIDIACADESKVGSRVIMLYATTPTSPALNAISRDCFPHQLTISITSDDMPLSEERRFELSIVDNKLKVIPKDDDDDDENPNIL